MVDKFIVLAFVYVLTSKAVTGVPVRARTGKRPSGICADTIFVTWIGGTFVYVFTGKPITMITVVTTTAKATSKICTATVGRAWICITFVDILALKTVNEISGVAATRKRAYCVQTRCNDTAGVSQAYEYPHIVFSQVAQSEHISVLSSHSSMSLHVKPLPAKPLLHEQLYEPKLFLHTASVAHSCS